MLRAISSNFFNSAGMRDFTVTSFQAGTFELLVLIFIFLNIINNSHLSSKKRIKLLLEYYEFIIKIGQYIVDNNLSIPLRETSEVISSNSDDKAITLDPYKVSQLPKLILK
jgi:hypothetical protein